MRNKRGSMIAELPVVIWIIFILLFFPFLDLASVCLRTYFLYQYTQQAALEAARAPSFSRPISPDLSAVQAAQEIVNSLKTSFTGIDVKNVDTRIGWIDAQSGASQTSNTPLNPPVDSSKSIYQIEVTTTADLEPFIPNVPEIFGSIPGLTAPMRLSVRAREYCESPAGLTI